MNLSFLIIGSPGRLRDALQAILQAIESTAVVYVANDFENACTFVAAKQPSVVIIDGSEYLDSDCHLLKRLNSHPQPNLCLVIAHTMQRAARARQVGADGVLMQGFTISDLRQVLVSLKVLPETIDRDDLPASTGQKVEAFPLSQTS